MPAPLISIVLPTYNRRTLLGRAIESVLRQTVSDFELLVVDDGSTDGTAELVSGFRDSRIHLIGLPANRGQSVARNEGIRRARGEWLGFQDSDDEWIPEKLERPLAAIRAEPGVALVYGDLLRVPARGEPFVMPAPELARGRVFDARTSGYAAYGIGIQSCLIRRVVFQSLGGFDEQLRCFEDLELLLRIVRAGHAARRIPEPLVRYYDTDGVSRVTAREYAARRRLLLRFALASLRGRPGWLWEESWTIRRRRRLDR